MFGRKRAHLVERAVERLAQSGELDDSAAHLLEHDQPAGAVYARAHPASPADVLPDAQPLAGSGQNGAGMHGVRMPGVGADDTGADDTGNITVDERAAAPARNAAAAPQPSSADRAQGVVDLPSHASDGDTRLDRPVEEPGPHTLIPREEGAGQPFVDMTSLFRAGMIDWNRVRSRVSEEFRLVQRQIVRTAFTAAGAEPGFSNLLMITSSIPGEGKSFTSLNLAACIARQRDHHVLLIDIDSKRDSFCMALGLGDAPGLLDIAANSELDASQVMAKTAIENLSVLPIGIERDLGPELFASKQMTKLIQAIGRRYADRLIVLDAPPTLSTSDPAALAPIVGQVLFVVEAERTQRDEVVSSLELLQACPTITLLLNKVQVQTRYTFGAYSTYYTS
ncbi:MAG TPA: AAA family ATPase [Acetobacteraceae bacterium]|jgi:protein-tyrosine kinase|nr:AAA family ATPase [Acetobacteraceae bacterium]